METDPKQALGRLLGPAEPEVGCDACFDELDRYVELELAGQRRRRRDPRAACAPRRLPGLPRGAREPAGARRRRAALAGRPRHGERLRAERRRIRSSKGGGWATRLSGATRSSRRSSGCLERSRMSRSRSSSKERPESARRPSGWRRSGLPTREACACIGHAVADYETLLRNEELDAVIIATPNHLHRAHGTGRPRLRQARALREAAGAERGRGVAIADAAKRSGKVLMYAMNNRFRGDVQVLRGYLERQELGKIFYAKTGWLRRRSEVRGPGWYEISEAPAAACSWTFGVQFSTSLRSGSSGIRRSSR